MLKISIHDTAVRRRLVVEGKLVHPWAAELKAAWSSANAGRHGREVMIDLSNATVIGPEGEDLLYELMEQGARFTCCGVLNRHVLRQLARRCHGRRRRALPKQSPVSSKPVSDGGV